MSNLQQLAATHRAPTAAGGLPAGHFELLDGLVGIPSARRFALDPVAGTAGLLGVLRNLDGATLPGPAGTLGLVLELLVAAPLAVWPAYHLELPDALGVELDLLDPADLAVAAIVTVRRPPGASTANLFAPLVLNCRNGRGRQHVPSRPEAETGFGTAVPLPG